MLLELAPEQVINGQAISRAAMNQDEMSLQPIITAKNVDLTNCDREQIQFAGAILPHGVMLILREPDFTIVQASQNTASAFAVEASALLGGDLSKLLDSDVQHGVIDKLRSQSLLGAPTRIATARIHDSEWNILAHRHDQVVFLEFEPRSALNQLPVSDLYSEFRPAIMSLQNAKSGQEFLDLAAEQIRAFTGFDRVMVYKFLQDGSGRVQAESLAAGHAPYLGQHFPPSDIPAPARRIFSMNWVRHQPDIGYTPVPLVPELNPVSGGPLDMSYAILRSVSPIYTSYLKNMGTQSSMVMTLLKDGKQWGLIACHHHSGPKYVPYEVRTVCEFLANMASLLIAEKEDLEFSDYKLALKSTQSALIEAMSRQREFAKALLGVNVSLLDFVRAGGAAVVSDGEISCIGKTPTEQQIQALVEWISESVHDDVFATNALASLFSEAQQFSDVASGVLAVRFAATRKDYLFWFRPEIIQTVKWAGDPRKPVDYASDGQKLLPRNSFALWIETVHLKSEPWLDLEVQAAREFRIAILEIIIRDAERLDDLYGSLERSHAELDAFAVATAAKFEALFEQTPVFAGILSIDGLVLRANKMCLEMCGYTADEVVGRSFWETGWWRGSESSRATIRRALQQAAAGVPYSGVLPYHWADGTEHLVDFALHPIRDDEGKIIFLHPTGVDITDLKLVEAELRRSQEGLEQQVSDRTRELALSLASVESEITIRKQTEEHLRDLSAQVLRLQDEERRTIARDLHDSTGQTLAALQMVVAQLAALLSDVPKAPKLFDELNILAEQASKEIRTISYLLHPPLLDDIGFSSAAQWYLEGFSERSGIKVTIDVAEAPFLSKAAELALFRVLQESLTNVLRHSGSSTAEVRLYSEGKTAVLSIRDCGKGIAPEKLNSFNQTGAGSGVGLGGMKQRIRNFGGQLTVKSDRGGTTILAMLPLEESRT
jgi:chemotaxis family two-component system sensor kinase Cph1